MPTANPKRDRPASGIDWCVVTAMIASGLFMFGAADRFTIFDDEALSCRLYVQPMGDMIEALAAREDPDPPLYYMAINGWIRAFGMTPLALRSLSILFFLGSIPVIFAAGRAWCGPTTARWTAILCAIHPAHLFFGLAARWYALMFLCVAVMLWAAGRIAGRSRQTPASDSVSDSAHAARASVVWFALWSIASAAAWYTNYFAPAVIAPMWLSVAWLCRRDVRRLRAWCVAALSIGVLYAPWWRVFWAELHRFPGGLDSSWMRYAASAARTAAALATGNLADPGGLSQSDAGAWWVWLPMTGFALLLATLLWRRSATVYALIAMAAMPAAAGVATGIMIDKYIMSFSAVTGLALAALLVESHVSRRRAARLAVALLATGWIGCGVNLVRESHWSSLRWIDPFPQVMRDIHARFASDDVLIATHPSARYYWGLLRGGDAAAENGMDWLAFSGEAGAPTGDAAQRALTDSRVRRVFIVETAGIGRAPETHAAIRDRLESQFRLRSRKRFAPDPAAARKNRLDARYHHPAYRIVTYEFVRR